MSSEREWIARCANLAQTEKDSIKTLTAAVDRASEVLPRDLKEKINQNLKIFSNFDPQFYKYYEEITNRISSLRPLERSFKDKLNRLEKEITTLRVQSASQLEKNSGNLRKILDDIDAREKKSTDLQTPAIRPKVVKQTFDSPISEFENYLNRYGGRTGGWDPQSHAEFVRKLEVHGPEKLADFLPRIPEESVKSHIEWYNEYLRLKTRMKQAINEMKQKNAVKAQNESYSPKKVDPEVVKQRLAEREERKRKEQELQQKMEEERRKKEAILKKKKFKDLQQRIKMKPPKPIVESEPKELKQDYRPKPKFNQLEWDNIRKRDQELIEQKKEAQRKREELEMKKREKEMKLAEENAKKYRNIQRDPDFLMKPTHALLAKQKKPDDEPSGPVNSIFDVPHLATPQWLK